MLRSPPAYFPKRKGGGMNCGVLTWVVSTVSQVSLGMLLQMVSVSSVQVSAASHPALSAGHLSSGPTRTHLQLLWGTLLQLVFGILNRKEGHIGL